MTYRLIRPQVESKRLNMIHDIHFYQLTNGIK